MQRRVAVEIVALLAGTGAMAGFVTAQFLPRTYVSRTAVAFTSKVSRDRCDYAATQTVSAPVLQQIILRSAYYKSDLDFTPVEEIIGRIQQSASINCARLNDKTGFRVEFADADRYLTLEMSRILVEEMGANTGSAMKIVEPVRAGTTGPGAGLCVAAGLACGALIGALTAALAMRH